MARDQWWPHLTLAAVVIDLYVKLAASPTYMNVVLSSAKDAWTTQLSQSILEKSTSRLGVDWDSTVGSGAAPIATSRSARCSSVRHACIRNTMSTLYRRFLLPLGFVMRQTLSRFDFNSGFIAASLRRSSSLNAPLLQCMIPLTLALQRLLTHRSIGLQMWVPLTKTLQTEASRHLAFRESALRPASPETICAGSRRVLLSELLR